jgi:NUMOD3 motif./HNH endonuclease.
MRVARLPPPPALALEGAPAVKNLYPEWDKLFLENKYARWYAAICGRGLARVREHGMYYERHHVIPKSFGGSNDRGNISLLTAREHFIVHCLLPRMCRCARNRIRMNIAIIRLSKNCKLSSKRYEAEQTRISKEGRDEEWRNAISESKRGKKQSEISRRRLSEANKGKKLSDEHKRKLSERLRGRKLSEEHKKKISQSLKGHDYSEERKQKQSLKMRGRKLTPEQIEKIRNGMKAKQQQKNDANTA